MLIISSEQVIWVITLLATLVLGIAWGFMTGLLVSVVIILLRTQVTQTSALHSIPGSHFYCDAAVYKDVCLARTVFCSIHWRKLQTCFTVRD